MDDKSKKSNTRIYAPTNPNMNKNAKGEHVQDSSLYSKNGRNLKNARTAAQYALVAQKAGIKTEKPRESLSVNTIYQGPANRQRSNKKQNGAESIKSGVPKQQGIYLKEAKPNQGKKPQNAQTKPISHPNRTKKVLKASGNSKITLMDTTEIRLKKQKLRKRRLKVFAIVFGTLLISGVLIFLAAVALELKTIRVNNGTSHEDAYIIGLSKINDGENLLLINTDEVKAAISADPILRVTDIKKIFPNSILISVEERNLVAVIENGGHKVGIDIDGNVLFIDKGSDTEESLKVYGLEAEPYFIGKNIFDKNNFTKNALFLTLSAIIEDERGLIVKSIDISNPLNIKIELSSSLCVFLGETTKLDEKLLLALNIEKKLVAEGMVLGILDLNIPEKPIYSPDKSELTPKPAATPSP
ncbi:MAG: FtsQ-type POTRA domain-containing protein [Clostridia bacterium]